MGDRITRTKEWRSFVQPNIAEVADLVTGSFVSTMKMRIMLPQEIVF